MAYKYIAVRDGYLGEAGGYIKEGQMVAFDKPIEEVFGTRADGSPKCKWLKPKDSPNVRLDSDVPVMPKMVNSSAFAAKGGVIPAQHGDQYTAHMADIRDREAVQDGNQVQQPQFSPPANEPPAPQPAPTIPLAATNDPKLQHQVGKPAGGETPPAAPAPAAPVQPAPATPAAPAPAAPAAEQKPGGSGTGNQDVLGQ